MDIIPIIADYPLIEYYLMCGNNEVVYKEFDDRVIDLNGCRIFITHGHRYGVKDSTDRLENEAFKLDVNVCLFGHTHIQAIYKKDNPSNGNSLLFLNPGSISLPHPYSKCGYGMLDIDNDGAVEGSLHEYK
jgi:hypothetical protein